MSKKYILGIIALSFVGILAITFFVFKRSKQTITTKDQVIAYLQKKYPELKEYPSDNLPPRSIVSEKADEGWYVAFVQEGSGRPIIEKVVGGDKDEHGCIGSAGYSWCQEKQKCLRIWEEPCGR